MIFQHVMPSKEGIQSYISEGLSSSTKYLTSAIRNDLYGLCLSTSQACRL